MKTSTIVLIGLGLVVLAGGAYFILKSKGKGTPPASGAATGTASKTSIPNSAPQGNKGYGSKFFDTLSSGLGVANQGLDIYQKVWPAK